MPYSLFMSYYSITPMKGENTTQKFRLPRRAMIGMPDPSKLDHHIGRNNPDHEQFGPNPPRKAR